MYACRYQEGSSAHPTVITPSTCVLSAVCAVIKFQFIIVAVNHVLLTHYS